MYLKLFLAITITLLVAGCARVTKINVPSNEVTFKTPHGELVLKHPQNTDMTNVFVRFETNGTVEARIGSLHTINSPEVIDVTAAGEVAKINAVGKQVRDAFESGAKALGAGAGAAAGAAK